MQYLVKTSPSAPPRTVEAERIYLAAEYVIGINACYVPTSENVFSGWREYYNSSRRCLVKPAEETT